MDQAVRPPSKADGGYSYLERILEALNHSRRRLFLYHLRETDPTDIEAAAKQVAAMEHGVKPSEVADDTYDHIRITLDHSHLPKLEELGVIDYDRRHGNIRFDDPPRGFEDFLDLTRSVEESGDR
jgi:hypothetical protein